MKRSILLMSLFMLTSIMAHAIPARPGIWRTITLKDGTTVKAMLKGDETMNFYEDKEGNVYMSNPDGTFSLTAREALSKEASVRYARRNAREASGQKRVADVGKQYIGNKRCLILLAEFPDMKFKENHGQKFYNDVMNKEGFTNDDGFVGSVKDYFLAQSDGKFNLTFDVKGPYMMSQNYGYYGQDVGNTDSNDANAMDMVKEACAQANAEGVDFSQYDWYGDGDVDLVYVIYAGYGQATGGDANTIWPHARRGAWISSYGGKQQRQYACSNELNGDSGSHPSGIGTICHEFSHCLGYPDMYDCTYSGIHSMGTWDIMCSGSYNGNSFRPAGYTAYEKWVAGWLTPTELSTSDVAVKGLKALSEGGGAYVIHNDGNRDEFYMLENRQQTGWDTELPGSGLLITHIDYDARAWARNTVNTTASHLRCAVVPADRILNNYTEADDAYPYNGDNRLTYESRPEAVVYNQNTDGSNLLNRGVTDITANADGTISFNFVADSKPAPPSVVEETVLQETFNKCNGKGGNNNEWGVPRPGGNFLPDVAGWETEDTDVRCGANKCALFGLRGYSPDFKSPSFTLSGDETTITVKVAPFASTKDQTFTVYLNDQQIGSYTLANEKWNTFAMTTTVKGKCQLKFSTSERLWFDDLTVVQKIVTSGIDKVTVQPVHKADNRIYSINGTFVGTDFSALPKGIYIMGGKKIVK